MTDGLDQALADAGLNLLRGDAQLTVYDGAVPSGATPPYVLVYTTVSRPAEHPDASLTGASARFVARWICHCVGGNGAAARGVAQRVRTQLLDVRPVVVGLTVNPIRQDDDLPPARDESTGVLVMDAVEVYKAQAFAS